MKLQQTRRRAWRGRGDPLTNSGMHGKMVSVKKKSTGQSDTRSFCLTTEFIARTSRILERGAALLPPTSGHLGR